MQINMSMSSLDVVYRTFLVLVLTALDGRCFLVREASSLEGNSGRVSRSSVTCEYNGKVYPPGEYQISPCVTCICEKSGELKCTSQTCEKAPGCIEYARVPGQCCAECLEYGCLYNGTGYPRGAHIPAGPCTKCYCPWEGGGQKAEPVCMDFHCPTVKCVDAVVPRGHCCPVCPNGKESHANVQLLCHFRPALRAVKHARIQIGPSRLPPLVKW